MHKYLKYECKKDIDFMPKATKKKDLKDLSGELEGVIISTTDSVPGYTAEKYLGFVWGTTVQSKFVGHDILAVLRSFIGGEVWPYTKMINEARHYVVHRMAHNAKNLGANGIMGVQMGTAQIIPGTIEIFAYGTAVKLRKD